MSDHEYEVEPVPGLPAHLPAGEVLLWQGAPRWTTLALRAFHLRKVAIYFALLVGLRAAEGASAGEATQSIALGCGWVALLGVALVGILATLAFLSARGTLYSITSRRVVMRHGIALTMSVNVPYTIVDGAAMKSHADGSGDISLTLHEGQRFGYLLNWPHVRPWRLARPEPTLRSIANVREVAQLLTHAVQAHGPTIAGGIELDALPAATGLEPGRTATA